MGVLFYQKYNCKSQYKIDKKIQNKIDRKIQCYNIQKNRNIFHFSVCVFYYFFVLFSISSILPFNLYEVPVIFIILE